MVVGLFLAIVWKVLIEFVQNRWRMRRDRKKDKESVV